MDDVTEDAFADALDRWGGDLHTWPHEHRSAALGLLERSAGARAELRAMQAVERALAHTGAQAARQVDQTLALVSAAPQQRPARLSWPKAAALSAAIAAAGFWYGVLRSPAPADWFGVAFASEIADVR